MPARHPRRNNRHADINRPLDHRGNAALHILCREGARTDEVQDALNAGADPNGLNIHRQTPLAFAIRFATPEIVETLIDAGASLYMPVGDKKFFNAVTLAVQENRPEILDVLLKKGGGRFVNNKGMDETGLEIEWPSLHLAALKGRTDLMPTLIRAGAFTEAGAGPKNYTPLMLAASQTMNESIRGLLQAGADINAHHPVTGETALHVAATLSRPWTLEEMLRLGADPDVRDIDGRTPLMIAATEGSYQTLRLLADAGADVNLREYKDGQTALHFAARRGNTDVARILLDHGANALLTDKFNMSAYAHAQKSANWQCQGILRDAEEKAVHAHFDRKTKTPPRKNSRRGPG